MATIRTIYRAGFAALMLAGTVLASPAQAAGTCTATLAQYTAAIKQLETFAAKAQALADQNPLYIADVFLMLAVVFVAFGALALVMRRPAAAAGAVPGH